MSPTFKTALMPTILISAMTTFFTAPLQAEGLYYGFRLGRTQTNTPGISVDTFTEFARTRLSLNVNDVRILQERSAGDNHTLYVGYSKRYYDFEVGFLDLGTALTTAELTVNDPTWGNARLNLDGFTETEGYYTAIARKFPIGGRMSIRAKGGIHFWEQRQRLYFSGLGSPGQVGSNLYWELNSDEDISAFYGLGLKWRSISLEYTRHEINSTEFDAFTLSFEYRI